MIPPRKPPHPIDVHVGSRLRIRRKILSISQTKLGDAVGLTFQQIQKYERGANRIGASRLYEFSKVLDIPISYFFNDLPIELRPAGHDDRANPENIEVAVLDPLVEPDSIALAQAYNMIEKASIRKMLFNLAKALGKRNKD